jgi:soluble lytic murein transglycosylase
MQAVILERKQDYKAAFDIYSTLTDSEYQIYVKNRMEILQKFYINPVKTETKTQKQTEETIFTKFEKNLLVFLANENIKQFFNLFYSLIFPLNQDLPSQKNLQKEEENLQNKETDDISNGEEEQKASTGQIAPTDQKNQKDLQIEQLIKILLTIKNDENIQQSIFELINQSEQILKQPNLPYMTQSKIYFYQFFFYLFLSKTDEAAVEKIQNSLYLSFFNGGLYYYQLISYCIINSISKDDSLTKALNLKFSQIDLNNFFDLSKDNKIEFNNLIKDKKQLRATLKNSFSQAKLKKTEYKKTIIKKHLFLANYFLENDLLLEFSRAIFYLRDLTQNYKVYNSLLVDFYNYSNQYDKAIYYQWDTIFTNFFPISIPNSSKIPSSSLTCIFPIWFIDIINQNIENFKDQFEPKVDQGSILLDPYFYLAIINAESSFSKEITSTANAIGLMQLLSSTAAWLRKTSSFEASQNLADPQYNIESGFYYIKYLSKTFNGNIISILGANNGGHNSFAKKKTASIHPLFVAELYPVSETSIYIKKIVRNYLFYKYLYENKPFESTIKDIVANSLQ